MMDPAPAAHAPFRHQRADGCVELQVRRIAGRDTALRAFQSGCGKVRMPRVHGGMGLEAVMLNTAGGLTGGDRFKQVVDVGPRAAATVATQAYEKIYRSSGGDALIETALQLDDGATLHWLPQPTLAYEGGRLRRRTVLHAPSTARFVAVESLILGRTATGEQLHDGALYDDWRVAIDGKLAFADQFRLTTPITTTADCAATLAGNRALATLLIFGYPPEPVLADLRSAIERDQLMGGASRRGDLIVVRLLANDGRLLSSSLTTLIGTIRREPLPRVWSI